jgi:hypothetical protein
VPGALGINSFPDFCGVAGLFVSVVGLIATWREARAAKTAAQQASRAANKMRENLNRFDVVKSLSETLIAFEEVKTLQRHNVWELLPKNYSMIKRELLSAKRMAPNLSPNQKKQLQTAIQTCASIENEIEIGLSQKLTVDLDIPRFNKVLSSHMVEIQDLLLHVRSQVGDQ